MYRRRLFLGEPLWQIGGAWVSLEACLSLPLPSRCRGEQRRGGGKRREGGDVWWKTKRVLVRKRYCHGVASAHAEGSGGGGGGGGGSWWWCVFVFVFVFVFEVVSVLVVLLLLTKLYF